MTDQQDDQATEPTIDFALMERLVDDHPDLSDEEILALYQQQHKSGATIALMADQLTDKTKVILASALPSKAAPTNTSSQAQYRIEKRIDAGGQSHVYLAHRDDGTYQKTVVIKLLNQTIEGETQKQQLMAEMQILADFKHPNIVTILDAGIDEQQRPWLMLEYIQGLHIDQYIKHNVLQHEQIISLCLSVAKALAYIHQQDVAHLDIKPANVMVEDIAGKPRPVIIDFGISMTQNITTDAAPYIFATPAFAAPEQLEQITSVPDHRSDVYAFGQLLRHALQVNPQPQGKPTKHPDLLAVINHCTAANPDDRYASMQPLIADLQHHLNDEPVSVRHLTWWKHGWRLAKKQRWYVIAVLITIGLMVTGLVNYFNHQQLQQATLATTKISQHFWQAADEISNKTKLIYAQPKRNIEPDFSSLNEQYDALKLQFNATSEAVRSSGYFAMAKAAISLGRYQEAQRHLLKAHELAPVDIKINGALAKNHLALYQIEAESLNNYADAEQRQLHQMRLQDKYFKPAMQLLNQQPNETQGADIVAASLLLHFQLQGTAALDQLTNHKDSNLWPIEKLLLAAQIAKDLGSQQLNQNNQNLAVANFKRANGFLSQAQAIARSHPEVYKQLCQIESQLLQLETNSTQAEITACDDLMTLLPKTADAQLVAANSYALLAKAWVDRGQSPDHLVNKTKVILSHPWPAEQPHQLANAEQIMGHVLTTQGLWQLYSKQQYIPSFMSSIAHHQKAVELLPQQYATQYDLATAWFLLAANSPYDQSKTGEQFNHAVTLLYGLREHADSTPVLTSLLVRVLTEHAYLRYQNGQEADDVLDQAEALVTTALQASEKNHATELAAAVLYWTYTDYLSFRQIDPGSYLKKTIGAFDQVIQQDPSQWTHRYNQISAMLSGVTYYLSESISQTESLIEIDNKLHDLSQLVAFDVDLSSHFGYFYNMVAINQMLNNKDPAAAFTQAREHNMTCVDSPVDGYNCWSQVATLIMTEHQWRIANSAYQLENWQPDIALLNQAISDYPKHYLLLALHGKILWLSTQWQTLQVPEQTTRLQTARTNIKTAINGNKLLKNRFTAELAAITNALNQLNSSHQ